MLTIVIVIVLAWGSLLSNVKFGGMWGPERAKKFRAAHVRLWRRGSPRIVPWVFRWKAPELRRRMVRSGFRISFVRSVPRSVRIAKRGILGPWVRIRIDRNILVTGITGSGKSCFFMALAAAVRATGGVIEFWDAKDGIEGQPYAKAGIPVYELESQPARLEKLLSEELPRRAAILTAREARMWEPEVDGPELIVIMDELGVSMGILNPSLLARFAKKARAYGVRIWAGEQLGKADVIDTNLRSQFPTRVALRTGRASDSRVALGNELVAEGWAPHELPARWLLIADDHHPVPRPARCATVPDDLLERYPQHPPVSLVKRSHVASHDASASCDKETQQVSPGEVVYVIGSENGNGLVKVGRTNDARKRLAYLQTGSPAVLEMLWTTPGGARLEAYLHEALSGRRKHGEWFDLGPDPVPVVQEAVTRFRAQPRMVEPKKLLLKDVVAEALMVTGEPITARQLAKELGKSPGSVHRVLAEMVKDGAAKRTPDGYVLATLEES